MALVVEQARAKVNLALHVLGRREDGYHALSSIVGFADYGDRLTLATSEKNNLRISGPFKDEVPLRGNIIWKAFDHLSALMPLPQVSVRLKKNLPMAAGLGGGSADAAAMLRGLLRLVGKSLNDAEVSDLAKAVGADVPACFYSKACLMEGIGESLTPFSKQLPPALVLVNPMVASSTIEVFGAMGLRPGQRYSGGHETWRNDMMTAAIGLKPVIAEVLHSLSETNLTEPLMSGSGSTCFGLAKTFAHAERQAIILARKHPKWWVKAARLS